MPLSLSQLGWAGPRKIGAVCSRFPPVESDNSFARFSGFPSRRNLKQKRANINYSVRHSQFLHSRSIITCRHSLILSSKQSASLLVVNTKDKTANKKSEKKEKAQWEELAVLFILSLSACSVCCVRAQQDNQCLELMDQKFALLLLFGCIRCISPLGIDRGDSNWPTEMMRKFCYTPDRRIELNAR